MRSKILTGVLLLAVFSSCVTQKGFERYADKHPERSIEVSRKTFDRKSEQGALYCGARFPTLVSSSNVLDSARAQVIADSIRMELVTFFNALGLHLTEDRDTVYLTHVVNAPDGTRKVPRAKLDDGIKKLAELAATHRLERHKDSAMIYYHARRADDAYRRADSLAARVQYFEGKTKKRGRNFALSLVGNILLAAGLIFLALRRTTLIATIASFLAAFARKKQEKK